MQYFNTVSLAHTISILLHGRDFTLSLEETSSDKVESSCFVTSRKMRIFSSIFLSEERHMPLSENSECKSADLYVDREWNSAASNG